MLRRTGHGHHRRSTGPTHRRRESPSLGPPHRNEAPVYAVLGPHGQGRGSKCTGTQENSSGARQSGRFPAVDAGMRCDYSSLSRY